MSRIGGHNEILTYPPTETDPASVYGNNGSVYNGASGVTCIYIMVSNPPIFEWVLSTFFQNGPCIIDGEVAQ